MGNNISIQDKRKYAITYSHHNMMEDTSNTIYCKYVDNRFDSDKKCDKLLETITPFYSDDLVSDYSVVYFHDMKCENIIVVENILGKNNTYACVNLQGLL